MGFAGVNSVTQLDSVKSYYQVPKTPSTDRIGWVKNGSSWYFYDKNGNMVTGHMTDGGKTYFLHHITGVMQHSKWQYHNGDWYYLNSSGAGMVKYWALSGGKWFYLKEDGKMAKSQWIEWYSKWYYVGSDGAMYVNRMTPDGRYVDDSGVRIR